MMAALLIKSIKIQTFICLFSLGFGLTKDVQRAKLLHGGKCRVGWSAWDNLSDSTSMFIWKGPKCLKMIIREFQHLNTRYSIGDFKRKIEKSVFNLLVEVYTPNSAGSASGSGIGKRLKGNAKVAVEKVLSKANGHVIGASFYVTIDDNYVIFQGETIAYINCRSEHLRHKTCVVNGPVTRVLYHTESNVSSFCIQPFTFGITNGLLYVKEGCSAMFTLMYIHGCIHRHSRVNFDRVVCVSSPRMINTTHTCTVPDGRQMSEIILIRQISSQHCHMRYGINKKFKNKIWVKDGCGGEFVYRYDNTFGKTRKQMSAIPHSRLCLSTV